MSSKFDRFLNRCWSHFGFILAPTCSPRGRPNRPRQLKNRPGLDQKSLRNRSKCRPRAAREPRTVQEPAESLQRWFLEPLGSILDRFWDDLGRKLKQFWIDFCIRVETHVKIRKWVSKVMGFNIFIHFSKQNAQGATKFKTKRMADSRKFGTYFGNFAAHIYRKKYLKTAVRGTS